MIIGVVNAQTEATIRLPVQAADGREQEMRRSSTPGSTVH